MEKVRIGILGCGKIAERMMIPTIRSMDEYELVAVSSRDKEKAELFAKKFSCESVHGYDQLLQRDDIQAVYIPLPTKLTGEMAASALSAGKHVLGEKSISGGIEQTRRLVELSMLKQKVIMECFSFVFHSQLDRVQTYLQRGEIGDLRLMRSSFGFPPFPDKQNIRYNRDLSGGALLDAGAYTIRASQLFLGSALKVLSASCPISKEYGVDVQGCAMLQNEDDLVSQIAFGFDNFYQNTIELWGAIGKITMERAFTAQPGFSPCIILEKQNERHNFLLPADHQFKNMLSAFHHAITNHLCNLYHQELLNQSRLITTVREYAENIR